MSTASAIPARVASPTRLVMRVTSWFPTNVYGTKVSRNASCRESVQASSCQFRSTTEDQTAFHSSYWVTESRPDSVTNAG